MTLFTTSTASPLPPSPFEVRRRVEQLYDHLYANARVRTPSAICEEVAKLLHAGMFREQEEGTSPAFSFTSRERRELGRLDESLVHQVATDAQSLFLRMNKAWCLYDSDVEQINLDNTDLAFACLLLDAIEIASKDRDVVGDALEIFRTQWTKRNGGQFFTDQRVTRLGVDLINFDPRKGDDLVDLCSGTGGFLLAGLNRIHDLAGNGRAASDAVIAELAQDHLLGREVDPEVCSLANSALRARIGDAASKQVEEGNALLVASALEGSRIQLNSHVCAATNPPFGTKTTVKDRSILQHFELSRLATRTGLSSSDDRLAALPPDVLFLELNIRILKPGIGRLAIVLPYQILSGPATRYIREWLLCNTKIDAVVDLPGDTFQPHTGTKTCLLILTRRKSPLADLSKVRPYKIFMSRPKLIGHDRRGNPVYRRDEFGQSTGEILTDIPEVAAAYQAFRRSKDPAEAHEQSFITSSKDVVADEFFRLNAQFYHPDLQSKTRSGTKTVRLGDVVDDVFFPPRFKRRYVDPNEGSVPFLGGTNITQLIANTSKHLDARDKVLDSVRVRPGWILVTRSGSTGIVSSVPGSWDGFAISEHVIRIVPDDDKLDRYYLQAFLRSRAGQAQLEQGVFGSVIDEITPEHIQQIEVPLLPTDRMNAISAAIQAAEDQRDAAIRNFVSAVAEIESATIGVTT